MIARKQRAGIELVCEGVFRPLAQLLVLVLRPLRVPPPLVVATGAGSGLAAAWLIGDRRLLGAALVLQLKTLLDNADGQLARASGRTSAFGRYLDSESDLLVNAAIFIALGHVAGRPWLAFAAFVALTLVLSANFNLERLYRRERGGAAEAMPPATGAATVLAAVYRVVYAPQDRLIERFCEQRLRALGADERARLRYHDRGTVTWIANYGLSTQLAALGVLLALGRPALYLWLVIGLAASLLPLALRREMRVRRSLGASHASEPAPSLTRLPVTRPSYQIDSRRR
ncbi:MAG: CDP-alcohol phosphatidyltransferase family protein [Gaiellaceae bacterium]